MQDVKYKRELGNGRWDRKLKENMVALSKADNYDEAKHEWIATGEVWWRGLRVPQPSWVSNEGYCLCGHHIVYHYEIHNTETNTRMAVGSDHINSYLILRAIREETGLKDGEITDSMIDEWVTVRVDALIKTAWWNNHGDDFTEMFDDIKELDLRLNVRQTGKRIYNHELQYYEDITAIRKVSSGKFGDPDYEMSSIVWRWNHPDNPRAQVHTRGYPNDKLWKDLTMFWAFIEQHKEKVSQLDEKVALRIEELKNHQEEVLARRERRLEQLAIAESARKQKEQERFELSCDYYGWRTFDRADGINAWERGFLTDMRNKILQNYEPTERQAEELNRIINRNDKPASDKQLAYVVALGYSEDTSEMTSRQVSIIIDKLKGEQNE